MRKSLAGGFCIVAALVLALGSGSAQAGFEGQTYGEAAATITSWGATPVIAARNGSYLPTDQCIVIRSYKSPQDGGKMLLDLNCNEIAAVYGHPGNSATSSQGKAVQARRDSAARISSNYAQAVAAGQQPYCASDVEGCINVCEAARSCSEELVEFLGM